jgi:thiamine transport system ATP-binding protein
MLRIDDLAVSFGQFRALDGISLAVAEHEIVCVLGPSGSGKSTLLRVVAGLQTPDSGRVLLDGKPQGGVPPHRRGVGLMFQDHVLFPQQDVAGNVGFGLRMRGERPDGRVGELLELVGLPGYGARRIDQLSGGEQQRVALARALAPEPRLLMLDEPLGQLDRTLRERLVAELRQLFVRLGTTVLAVTHDQGEAFALADRVVIMNRGRIAQDGPPQDVWQRPASEFVARFLGFENVAKAKIAGGVAATPWGPVAVDAPDGEWPVLIRPSAVVPDPDGPLDTTVAARTFRGDHVTLLLAPAGGPPIEASVPLADAPLAGAAIRVRIDAAEAVPGESAEPSEVR